MPRTLRWTVVIPIKSLPAAKSRLAPASVDAAAHRRLVEAIREDTIAAARSAVCVARVLLVTDTSGTSGDSDHSDDVADSADELRVVQVHAGLNGALRDGASHAASRWPHDGIAALVGDLPSLRPEELDETLAAAAAAGGGFVPDAEGTGTTLLAAVPGHPLTPRFGAGSAARHAELGAPLPAGPGLRRDVDTAEDLRNAEAEVGVGPATSAVLAGAACSPSIGMICR